ERGLLERHRQRETRPLRAETRDQRRKLRLGTLEGRVPPLRQPQRRETGPVDHRGERVGDGFAAHRGATHVRTGLHETTVRTARPGACAPGLDHRAQQGESGMPFAIALLMLAQCCSLVDAKAEWPCLSIATKKM